MNNIFFDGIITAMISSNCCVSYGRIYQDAMSKKATLHNFLKRKGVTVLKVQWTQTQSQSKLKEEQKLNQIHLIEQVEPHQY